MNKRRTFQTLAFALLIPALPAQQISQDVLIRTAKPYTALVNGILARGGSVTHQYKYVDAVAARIPVGALDSIGKMVPAGALSKDSIIPLPSTGDSLLTRGLARTGDEGRITATSIQPISAPELSGLAQSTPSAYTINNAIMNVSPLHGTGIAGTGVIVAVIDSGIRPGFPHLSLDGSVIGCEDFVLDALGCSNFANSGHGTFVAGMISANIVFTLAPASPLRDAILAECPSCFIDPPVNTQVPMIGTAPMSSIYAFRVFGPTGGAPTSRILAAVERVIELREKFDAGVPGGVNIQVCNMSLGGPTFFPGRDLFDTAIDAMLAKGIVPVIAAGNAGPSSLTIGSPGSSFSALTVGAASQAHNERILRRAQFGPLIGALYRPFSGTQTAYFSSRGPNADGRTDPDVTANGFANFGQGTGPTVNSISIGSGSSFSAPSVSGIAALLRQSQPGATARQIRNAIIMSANPALLNDGSNELDRGAGYVDAAAAASLLASGKVPDSVQTAGKANPNVKVNIEQSTTLKVRNGLVQQTFSALKPGQRHDILYRVSPNTKQVIISLTKVTPSLPAAQQNQLFGDDVLLAIHTAKTSSIGDGDYRALAFTSGGTFVVDSPELGIMRITVSGDWTNAGTISGLVTILSTTEPIPEFTRQGKISNSETLAIPVNVPSGVAQLDVRAGWREDWASFPTNDIDMILIAPDGTVNLDGGTLSNPEVAVVSQPLAGTWVVLLNGFDVASGDDKYELRVAADGKVLR
jgi:hypothetical protein